MSAIREGQTLLRVPASRRENAHEVRVGAVGRRWANIYNIPAGYEEGRIDVETLLVDNRGIGYADRCYLSQEHFEAKRRADEAWRSIRDWMGRLSQEHFEAERRADEAWRSICDWMGRRGRPEGVTAESLAEVARLIGMRAEDGK